VLAALDRQTPGLRRGADSGLPRPAGHVQAGHGADRRQCLAAKPEGFDVHQVVAGQLRGGVPLDRQGDLLGGHAAAVVGHRDQRPPAVAHGHVDVPGAGIQGVFHQFLDRRRRALDHLAGGDPVDQGLGQAADGHGVDLLR